MTQALTITAVKYRFFLLSYKFYIQTLSSVVYCLDVYKHSEAEHKISATKFRKKSGIICIV